MKKVGKFLLRFLMVLGFLGGLTAVLYPFISNAWNAYRDNLLMSTYIEKAAKKDLSDEWEKAHKYNETLIPSLTLDYSSNTTDISESDESYMSCLNLDGNGIMGYIYIPKLGERIPIMHGTGDHSLSKGAGHMYGTHLPVGGEGTHCALAAHRGVPGKSLFTDLDQMEVGDQFYLYILDDVLAYEVDQIVTVLPTDLKELESVEGEDLVTLVTCTPYGINTHRLLVRGHRVPYEKEVEEEAEKTPVQTWNTSYLLLALIAIGATLVILLILLLILRHRRKKRARRREAENSDKRS